MQHPAESVKRELQNILNYWSTYTVDHENGGFYGKIDNENVITKKAPKGSVLNARILWTFSAAYNQIRNPEYLQLAKRSFDYFKAYFMDQEYGGVYWSVDYNGNPLNDKKQIYALAFALYGLSEYHLAVGDEKAFAQAKQLFDDIERHSFDQEKCGYTEALTRDWKIAADLRLSDKDANEKKTMNTHLHILEAYTNLYRIWPDEKLNKQIRGLLDVFQNYIIDPQSNHLRLFMDENWISKSTIISYGHDIEAAWLLQEAAEVLHDERLITRFKTVAVGMAKAAAEGLDTDGGLDYELEGDEHRNQEKHWWVQAEAMVGFLNAYQDSGEQHFYNKFLSSWDFINKHIIDHEKGEWFWGVNNDHSLMEGEDKAGFWKCPYHNSRACMEVIKRLA